MSPDTKPGVPAAARASSNCTVSGAKNLVVWVCATLWLQACWAHSAAATQADQSNGWRSKTASRRKNPRARWLVMMKRRCGARSLSRPAP
jgi:hypothetical protein